tara:strand:- start:46 stop:255 length:210 start_codon:yes stop_codon:yes gene_type:complete
VEVVEQVHLRLYHQHILERVEQVVVVLVDVILNLRLMVKMQNLQIPVPVVAAVAVPVVMDRLVSLLSGI